jgi:hypothetical protein
MRGDVGKLGGVVRFGLTQRSQRSQRSMLKQSGRPSLQSY